MPSLIKIDSTAIHQDAEGRYSLNDLHEAAVRSGVTKDIRPNEWLALNSTKDMAEILITENPGNKPIVAVAGRYGGTFVVKELVYAYAMWISPKFHLHVIQTFDQAVNGKPSEMAGVINATKLFQPFFRIARQIGLDKNAAAISANQATLKLSGQNVLQLMGQTHLEAENQDSQWFTPTELGKARNFSARSMNLLLAEAGLQHKVGEHWTPTAQAEGFCRLFDTGKKYGDGTPVTQIKWAQNVLHLVRQEQVE